MLLIVAMLVYAIGVNADNIKSVFANNITYSSAEINWDSLGSETKWNIRYKPVSEGVKATVTLTAGDVWGDGSGYQMLLDADANAYGAIIPKSGNLTESGDAADNVYAEFEYKIPEQADGSLTTTNIVVNNSITISIPAGKYDWCITNPNPGKKMWIVSSNGRQNDYFFEPGKHYEFVVTRAMIGDQVNITITDNPIDDDEGWTYLNDAASNSVSIGNLSAETMYMVQVQTVGEDTWTPYAYFTTTSVKAMPILVEATDITSHSAEISWLARGAEEKWNLRYRKNVGLDNYDFEDGFPDNWTTIDNDGDGYSWFLRSQEGEGLAFCHSGAGCMMSESYKTDNNVSEGLNPDNWLISPQFELGGSLSFWMRSAIADYPDYFAVYLSTTGSSVDDFTIELQPETAAEGEYVNYTIDLSAYSGKGYVAFRHFNSEDMYYLLLDDVTLTEPDAVVFRWTTAAEVTNPYVLKGLSPSTKYEVQVQSVYDDGTTGDWTRTLVFWTLEDDIEMDVNHDGSVNIADVTALVNIILDKDNLEPFLYDHDAADINQDSSINNDDVTALISILLGIN